MTTKLYQAQLPLRNHRIVTPTPLPPRHPLPPQARTQTSLHYKLRRFFLDALQHGFWFCKDCDAPTEREEGEHGQPAHCERCKSPRIQWTGPMMKEEVA